MPEHFAYVAVRVPGGDDFVYDVGPTGGDPARAVSRARNNALNFLKFFCKHIYKRDDIYIEIHHSHGHPVFSRFALFLGMNLVPTAENDSLLASATPYEPAGEKLKVLFRAGRR